jgi:hypothetical protein
MSRKRKDVVFVSFYTSNYSARAEKLQKSLEALNLKHDIREIGDLGSFEANVSYKPRFIGEMMDAHPKSKAIVWLDADATVLSHPALFWAMWGIDLACHYREGVELLSGTMYWANTNKAKQIIANWCIAMDRGEGKGRFCPEQQVLQRHVVDWNVELYDLPTEYCYIEDLPEKNDAGRKVAPIIDQGSASRTERHRQTGINSEPVKRVKADKPEDLSIAILLPTRERQDNVVRLLRSIEKTAAVLPKVSVHIRLDGDDHEMIAASKRIRKSASVKTEFSIGPRVSLGATWNNLWKNVDADIYMLCADDMIFESERWDEKVREHFWGDPVKLVFGKDGVQNGKLATHFFLSHQGCELLGYFCPPQFEAIYLDTWVDHVYRAANVVVYDEKIVIPHLHWTITGKADASVTRDRGGRKARDQQRWDSTVTVRQSDAAKLEVLP